MCIHYIYIYIYTLYYIMLCMWPSRRISPSRARATCKRDGRLSNAPKGNGIGATGSQNQTRFLEPGAKGS